MPILARLRFGSIGAEGARFDPLDLELVGEDRRLRHTLLFLRNGGGKSSLIALTLLLLNPKVGWTLGKTQRGDPKREIDYVRKGETGIVLAEWIPDRPTPGRPRTLVTIMALQRGEREDAAEKGFIAATLPMDADPVALFELRQLLPLEARATAAAPHGIDALLRRAREIERAHGDWDVKAFAGHEPKKWLARLQDMGLHPGIAQLLARMNLEEGDLAKALTFSSAEEFVAQAARLLAPPEDVVRNLHVALASWTAEFRDQGEKRATRSEIERVRPLWEALVERVAARASAFEGLKRSARDVRGFQQGVEDAMPRVDEAAALAKKASDDADVALAAAKLAAERLTGEEAALALAIAGRALEEADRALEIARAEEKSAALEARIASARIPALRLIAAESSARELQKRLSERAQDADVTARIARRDGLAVALADHERERARRAGLAHADAVKALEAAIQAKMRLGHAHEDAIRREAAARADLVSAKDRLRAARAAVDGLIASKMMLRDETLDAAHARASAAALEGRERLSALGEAQSAASAEARAGLLAQKQLDRQLEEIAGARARKAALLEEARTACTAMETRLSEARLDLGATSLPRDGQRTSEAVARAHTGAVMERTEVAARLATLEEACRSLAERDVLPASQDVRRVAAAGGAAFQPALEYVGANLREDAGAALRAHPGLAHAVVVGSAAALERARESLDAIELSVDTPVPIYLGGDLSREAIRASDASLAARAIVGVGPHASGDARERLLAERTAAQERTRRQLADIDARAAALETLRRDLAECLARSGAETQAALQSAIGEADAKVRAWGEERRKLDADARARAGEIEERAREIASATAASKAADATERALDRAATAHAATLRAGDEAIRAIEERVRLDAAALGAAREAREKAEKDERDAREDGARAAREQGAATEESRRLRALASRPEMKPLSIDADAIPAARGELDSLHAALEGGERALRAELDVAQREVGKASSDLDSEAGTPALAATVRAELPAGLDEARARREKDLAREREHAAVARSGAADHAHGEAKRALAGAQSAVEDLRGEARASASALAPPEGDTASLRSIITTYPARHRAAQEAIASAGERLALASAAAAEAKTLVRSWKRLVDGAQEAWSAVKLGDLGPDDARAILAVVSATENARIIPDPPARFLAGLEKELKGNLRVVSSARSLLTEKQAEVILAAQKAHAAAEKSPSKWVRDAATVRGAAMPDGGALEEENARLLSLASRADRDLASLELESESLDAQLADVAKTQTALAGQVGEQTRRLAARVLDLKHASKLPMGLGEWSGKVFLEIELILPSDDAELVHRLEGALATWAEADRLPAARDLLPDALARALTSPPRVLMPKADRFDVFRRRPIQQLSKDSGGEALTAAFILFCIIARVAAGGRRGGDRVTLALIDNPLGTANKFDFVDAQCRVAAAFGVQYIAASGIPDPAAIERFERLITLTNAAQARVRRSAIDDQHVGRPIETVLFAREEVLPSPGVPARFASGEEA